ncbi:MAG: DNA polymerase III subunit alpha, partial [Muribaculaceae bacterium]|nr:DNA polymerase III subunit alpha [Muribaculaceae bacterium]
IKQTRGFDLAIENIPLDDPATFKLYCEGRTTSTFQFESAGMQNSLRDLKPSKFEDLIAMNALYRPGPMDYIPSFIKRKHGEEPITYDIPIMEKYLQETYGITVYQEQVMLLSRLLSNFTRGESDMLRKAMGKKQIDKMAKLKVKFMSEGQKNGHKAQVLEKIWADWEKFASYAFNKSHATCYTWVAYQTAYLKANYPAEYMAGVLSRNLNAADKLKKIMEECIRMGISVKGPDVNESWEKFGVNKKGEIRFGLGAVKGVGSNAVNAIISERQKNGPFKDIYDFVERVNLGSCNRASIENLAMAGSFDSMGYQREAFIEPSGDSTFSDALVKYGQIIQNDKNSLQMSLFGDEEPLETNKPPFPMVQPWNHLKLLEEEKKLVTIYLSAHPLDPYYMELTYGCNCSCADFEDKKVPGAKLTMGGMVTAFNVRTSKSGNDYAQLTIEDLTGTVTFSLFGRAFEAHKNAVTVGDPVYMKVNVVPGKWDPTKIDVNIDEIHPLDALKGSVANAVSIYLSHRFDTQDFFTKLLNFPSKERLGDLYIDLYNQETRQVVKIHSRKKFPVNKDFLNFLDEWGIKYRVLTV